MIWLENEGEKLGYSQPALFQAQIYTRAGGLSRYRIRRSPKQQKKT